MYILVLFAVAIAFTIPTLANAQECGSPPRVDDESLKGELHGQAKLLSDRLRDAGLEGQIETAKSDIFSKYPDANKARTQNQLLFYLCGFVLNDPNLPPQEKAGIIQKFWQEPKVSAGRAPEDDCDWLAAHPADPEAVTRGIGFDQIESGPAIRACERARSQYPTEKRFSYQLARAYGRANNPVRQRELLEQLVHDDYPAAFYSLGAMYKGKNSGVANDLFRKAAEKGHVGAMEVLFSKLLQSAETRDRTEGIAWLKEAANAGNAKAQIWLGDLYREGKDVPKDELRAFELYRQAVEIDDHYGCFLARAYREGKGVTKEPAEAAKWFEKAAAQGCTTSMLNLGDMYAEGTGVPKDEVKAMEWFRRAADAGQSTAMWVLAEMYRKGHGELKSTDEAFRWALKSAEADNAVGMYIVGEYYRDGIGVVQDPMQVARWTLRSAEKGYVGAMKRLADLHIKGKGVAKDANIAVGWMRKAADQGDSEAMFELGQIYEEGWHTAKDEAEAARWYKRSVEKGYDLATPALARMYLDGRGVQKDEDEAIRLLHKGEEAKNPFAIIELGYAYQSGRGLPKNDSLAFNFFSRAVEIDSRLGCPLAQAFRDGKAVAKDPAEAAKWFEKAAEGIGCTTSMVNLALMHLEGTGVPKDDVKAMEWFRRAADGGDSYAMSQLGVAYYGGHGVERSYPEALSWFRKSADAGQGNSMTWIGEMHELGQAVAKNETEAAAWYRRAIDTGDLAPLLFLGRLYAEGRGVEKSETEARDLFRRAARAKNIEPVWSNAVWLVGDSDLGRLGQPDQTATLMMLTLAEFPAFRERLVAEASKFPASVRRAIQASLKRAGVYRGKDDGSFGPTTRAALDAYAARRTITSTSSAR